MSVSLSVRPHGKTGLPENGASGNLSIFGTQVEKIQVSLKFEKNNE
jgi:hypothetical protein